MSVRWQAPLDSFRFALELADYDARIPTLAPFAEADRGLLEAVLEEAARLCAEVVLPLDRQADREGCRLEDGRVRTPRGFREAWRRLAEGGWLGLAIRPEYGGQGLPQVLQIAFAEMLSAASMAFSITPGLTQGAAHALERHGSEAQRRLCLPNFAAGRWAGTMCLTEPQAGTDLGLVRTRAEPAGGGRHRLYGEKIFISAGAHDLTDNIVHLVLARLPDAPWGTRGLSLFLVPARRIGADGEAGEANALACTRLEEKMGLHGSPTCALVFEGAEGWLVGEPHAGLRAMFDMMNAARLAVGVQALGVAEKALQSAAAYVQERLQGRAPGGPLHLDRPADPLIVQPDVRRLLLGVRARSEALRLLAVEVAVRLDLARHHPDAGVRAEADDFASLMTPILKAHGSDFGLEAAVVCQQLFGGHGYIREHGMEQLVRDVRIASIYEGANAVQALDLVGRKMRRGAGRALRRLFHPLLAFLETHRDHPAVRDGIPALAEATAGLQRVVLETARRGAADPEAAAAVASDLLEMTARVVLAWTWLRALVRLDAHGGPAGFAEAAPVLARFYLERILPETGVYARRILAGGDGLAVEGLAGLPGLQ